MFVSSLRYVRKWNDLVLTFLAVTLCLLLDLSFPFFVALCPLLDMCRLFDLSVMFNYYWLMSVGLVVFMKILKPNVNYCIYMIVISFFIAKCLNMLPMHILSLLSTTLIILF